MGPDSSLLNIYMILIMVKFPILAGISPLKEFKDSTRFIFLSKPISVGINPKRLLNSSYKLFILVKFPRVVGISLLKKFFESISSVKCVSFRRDQSREIIFIKIQVVKIS